MFSGQYARPHETYEDEKVTWIDPETGKEKHGVKVTSVWNPRTQVGPHGLGSFFTQFSVFRH